MSTFTPILPKRSPCLNEHGVVQLLLVFVTNSAQKLRALLG